MKYAVFFIDLICALMLCHSLRHLFRLRRSLKDILSLATLLGDTEIREYALSRLPDIRKRIIVTAIFACLLIALAVIVII